MDNNKNFLIFIAISVLIIFGFNYLRGPVRPAAVSVPVSAPKTQATMPATSAALALRDRAEVIKETPRVPLQSPELAGSINLKGARIDDLVLTRYRETVDPQSPMVTLLSPAGSAAPYNAYYAEFSWLADRSDIVLPNADTIWQAQGKELSPGHPLKLTWKNGQGLTFEREITVDDRAMFTLADRIINDGDAPVTLFPYGLVSRQGNPVAVSSNVSYEGPLGVLGGTLEEFKYKKLMEDGRKTLDSEGGWIGITSKYWLAAMVPPQDEKLTADFAFDDSGVSDPNQGRFQTDFRGGSLAVPPHGDAAHTVRFFAGAKRIRMLDSYAEKYDIPHFDRAIDFGWFYFLTKPFLYALSFLGVSLGSLGIAILVFTVMLKLITLPLSLKSNHSMARMKVIQPEIKRIQERYADDKIRQNQETMELFKREKVNPMSGCVPTLIQIPIFFALYKILYVGIEMRQAPFFGWIRDMSQPDPTSWLNLFGLGPWGLPHQIVANLGFFTLYLPPALHIGAWPILMGCSMFLQQRLSPQAVDKSQARMFMFLPFLFTYMLSNMPAGLVIYWTWSNLLSILQQWYIMKRDAARKT